MKQGMKSNPLYQAAKAAGPCFMLIPYPKRPGAVLLRPWPGATTPPGLIMAKNGEPLLADPPCASVEIRKLEAVKGHCRAIRNHLDRIIGDEANVAPIRTHLRAIGLTVEEATE